MIKQHQCVEISRRTPPPYRGTPPPYRGTPPSYCLQRNTTSLQRNTTSLLSTGEHHLPTEEHHLPTEVHHLSTEEHHLPTVYRGTPPPYRGTPPLYRGTPPPCRGTPPLYCLQRNTTSLVGGGQLESAEMGTLSPSYIEERTTYLLLKAEEDDEDGRTNGRQDEQEREDGSGEEGNEGEEMSSCSSEQETDVEKRTKSSGRVGDSENSTGENEVRCDRKPAWAPHFLSRSGRDVYNYAGHDILIYESIDSYGSVMWPAALALCSYLESQQLLGRTVLELGAGTGLVTIVSCLLGAAVTATDLPDVLGNLTANVMRNTRGRCRYVPRVAALSWGEGLELHFPRALHRYNYVLAADVVYHHDFLEQLLLTMQHFCQPGTTLLWANKVRFGTDLSFTRDFQQSFHTELLVEEGDMKIYKATSRE
ncbi:hypothetical protein CRUP_017435 [Coryphaenoides rupestris]|nr:hypothetical protein CRUP_017435 [Coryphaenoides rupestris]